MRDLIKMMDYHILDTYRNHIIKLKYSVMSSIFGSYDMKKMLNLNIENYGLALLNITCENGSPETWDPQGFWPKNREFW